ncbi:hypothetical protein [Halostella sp. PRR32]|uniref:hypothetical protein n=1 Tax=Halostella sp. PRR32 TaxID=3098147 RepID=UPI002B1DA5F9|nr:hypothetical protein [Halostella sp. PRR32]
MHLTQIVMEATAGPKGEQVSRTFFLDRILERNTTDFEQVRPDPPFFPRLEGLIEEYRDEIREQLSEFGEIVAEAGQDIVFSAGARFPSKLQASEPDNAAWKYTGNKTDEDVLIFLSDSDNKSIPPHFRDEATSKVKLYVVASHVEDSKNFLGFFGDEIEQISNTVGQFVKMEEYNKGGEIARKYFNKKIEGTTLSDWYSERPVNEFEEEVLESVQNKIGVCLSNVNIEMEMGENPEYDVVALPLGDQSYRFAIEVKNYKQEDNEEVEEAPAVAMDSGELRNELITKPKEEADRADLSLITIVKGLKEDQYENLRRHADTSNVLLLNEENYDEELEEHLLKEPLRNLSE